MAWSPTFLTPLYIAAAVAAATSAFGSSWPKADAVPVGKAVVQNCEIHDDDTTSRMHGAKLTVEHTAAGVHLNLLAAGNGKDVADIKAEAYATTSGFLSLDITGHGKFAARPKLILFNTLQMWQQMLARLAPYAPIWKTWSAHLVVKDQEKIALPSRIGLAFGVGYQYRQDGSLGGDLALSSTVDRLSKKQSLPLHIPQSFDQWAAVPMAIDLSFISGSVGAEAGERVEVEWLDAPYVKSVRWAVNKVGRTMLCQAPQTVDGAKVIEQLNKTADGAEINAAYEGNIHAELSTSIAKMLTAHEDSLAKENDEALHIIEAAYAQACAYVGQALIAKLETDCRDSAANKEANRDVLSEGSAAFETTLTDVIGKSVVFASARDKVIAEGRQKAFDSLTQEAKSRYCKATIDGILGKFGQRGC